jgi:hypothetical protein
MPARRWGETPDEVAESTFPSAQEVAGDASVTNGRLNLCPVSDDCRVTHHAFDVAGAKTRHPGDLKVAEVPTKSGTLVQDS